MIDHIGIPVSDYQRAKAFYTQALAPLGIGLIIEVAPESGAGESAAGFGAGQKPFFWIDEAERVSDHTHVAFAAETRRLVDAFYRAAISAGGRDNGAPGLRPQYHADYYGGFVLDPDGHNIEAVCHKPD